MTAERRAHPRRPLELEIRIDGPKGRSRHTARDLSPAGVFVETSASYRVGQLLECRIEVPSGGGKRRLELNAEVRHLSNAYETEDGRGPYRGVGLRFVRMDAQVLAELQTMLSDAAGTFG